MTIAAVGAIHQMDEGVSIILKALDQHDLAENTIVVFAADHGLAMPRAKCTLHDPGISAALLMRWPAGNVRGGRRLRPLVSHVDVVPTLLEALELPGMNQLHGRSFWPLLQDEAYRPNEAIFA